MRHTYKHKLIGKLEWTVSLIASAYRRFQTGGVSELLSGSFDWVLLRSPVSDFLKSMLGRQRIEQLVMAQHLHYWPDICDPTSFNEHIAYRKLHTCDSRFVDLSDKYAVREFVRSKVGEEVLTDLYWVGTDPCNIPFDDLPNEYVIKSTHDSGHVQVISCNNTISKEKNKIRSYRTQ